MCPQYCLNVVESGASFAVLYPVVAMGSFVMAEEAGKVSLIGSLLPAPFSVINRSVSRSGALPLRKVLSALS
jgi:hypothetical protein